MARSGWIAKAQKKSITRWCWLIFFEVMSRNRYLFWKEPEWNVHEIHSPSQRVVWDATSPRNPDGRLQSQVLENPSPWADPSHHLQQISQINWPPTQKCTYLLTLHVFFSFTHLSKKDWDTGQRPEHKEGRLSYSCKQFILNAMEEHWLMNKWHLLPLNSLGGDQERHEVPRGHFIITN